MLGRLNHSLDSPQSHAHSILLSTPLSAMMPFVPINPTQESSLEMDLGHLEGCKVVYAHFWEFIDKKLWWLNEECLKS